MAGCALEGAVRCETKTLVGCWDAAYGDQSAEGNCRLGCVIGLMSPTLSVLRRILRGTLKSMGGSGVALSWRRSIRVRRND